MRTTAGSGVFTRCSVKMPGNQEGHFRREERVMIHCQSCMKTELTATSETTSLQLCD